MVLTLTDDLNIQHIDRLKQTLQQELSQASRLEIDLTGAGSVDAAFLQLLCAVHADAARQQKKVVLRLAAQTDSPFHRACQALGLERLCPERT